MLKRILVLLFLFIILGCKSTEFQSALMYVNENNIVKAEEQFKLSIQMEPENALVRYRYAKDVLKPESKWEELVKIAKEAQSINKNQLIENPFESNGQIIKTIGQATDILIEEAWIGVYNIGINNFIILDSLITKNNLNTNLDSLKNLVNKNISLSIKILPEDERGYLLLSKFYQLDNNNKEAILMINNKMKNFPENNLKLLGELGDLYTQDKNYTDAIIIYKLALTQSSKKYKLNFLLKLFNIYYTLGEYENAITYIENALEEDNKNKDLFYNAAVLYMRIAGSNIDEVSSLYNHEANIEKSQRNQENLDKLLLGFQSARKMYLEAREYFYEAEYYGEVVSSEEINKIQNKMNQLDNIFIPSVRDMME